MGADKFHPDPQQASDRAKDLRAAYLRDVLLWLIRPFRRTQHNPTPSLTSTDGEQAVAMTMRSPALLILSATATSERGLDHLAAGRLFDAPAAARKAVNAIVPAERRVL